jgi:hypothetical protein
VSSSIRGKLSSSLGNYLMHWKCYIFEPLIAFPALCFAMKILLPLNLPAPISSAFSRSFLDLFYHHLYFLLFPHTSVTTAKQTTYISVLFKVLRTLSATASADLLSFLPLPHSCAKKRGCTSPDFWVHSSDGKRHCLRERTSTGLSGSHGLTSLSIDAYESRLVLRANLGGRVLQF